MAHQSEQATFCLSSGQVPAPLLSLIDRRARGGRRLILAIDGRCASGKTSLAAALERIYGCNVFHMDDFFLRPEQRTTARYAQPGGNVDAERFLKQVLCPLAAGETVSFSRFDCARMALMPPVSVPPRPISIVEGAYSLRPDLRPFYDAGVFLDIDPALQRRRLLEREGPERVQTFLTKWIPLEEAYIAGCRPQEACDLVLKSL